MLTHEEFIEIGKIMSDFFKQMITVDTGVLVLIVTIVEKVFTTEKVFRARRNLILLVASVLSFVGSLFLALKALVVIPSRLTILLQGGIVEEFVDGFSFYGTIYFFFGGVVIFLLLATSIYSSFTPAYKAAQPSKTE